MVFYGCSVKEGSSASDALMAGVECLSHIGSDGVGACTVADGRFHLRKKSGKVLEFLSYVSQAPLPGNFGMAHLRWATHGASNDQNTHPLISNNGKLALVHNGIIENEHPLRLELERKGYTFSSETDSEVLVNIIQDVMENSGHSL